MKQTIITQDQFENMVHAVCRDIANSAWRPDYVVGITRGGLIPAVMISHYFNIPCHTLKVNLRDHSEDCESNLWMADHAYDGRKILIVDDINDTGASLNWIMQDWQSSNHPNSETWSNGSIWNNTVRFAVLVDNLSSEFAGDIDFRAQEINKAEDDQWVVFPWERWWTT